MSLAGKGTTAGGGSPALASQTSYISAPARPPTATLPPLARSEPAAPVPPSSPSPVDSDVLRSTAADVVVGGACDPPHADTASGSEATTSRSKNRARAFRGMKGARYLIARRGSTLCDGPLGQQRE